MTDLNALQAHFGKYLRAVILEAGLVDALKASDPTVTTFAGASADAIAALEAAPPFAQSGRRLPRAYREYLEELGEAPGPLFSPGTRARIGELAALQGGPAVPADAFVFLATPGGAFEYFQLDGGDDPQVFRHEPHRPEPLRLGSLSDSLVSRVWERLETLGGR
jgi:hypothetical protein